MLKTVIPGKIYLCPPVTNDVVVALLKEAGTTHVINATEFDNSALLIGGGFKFLLSGFRDTGQDQNWQVWEDLRTFLLEWKDTGGKLAIHCIGGPRRSVSVAYLALRLMDLTDDQAVAFLRANVETQHLDWCYSGPINDWLGRRDQVATVIGSSQNR